MRLTKPKGFADVPWPLLSLAALTLFTFLLYLYTLTENLDFLMAAQAADSLRSSLSTTIRNHGLGPILSAKASFTWLHELASRLGTSITAHITSGIFSFCARHKLSSPMSTLAGIATTGRIVCTCLLSLVCLACLGLRDLDDDCEGEGELFSV